MGIKHDLYCNKLPEKYCSYAIVNDRLTQCDERNLVDGEGELVRVERSVVGFHSLGDG